MLLFVVFVTSLWAAPSDSLRTEEIDGQLFVIHQIEAKETLYGISKRYGAPIAQVLRYNSEAERGLQIGQILKVPYQKPSLKNIPSHHEALPDETLADIAARYRLSEEQLKKLNKLSDNTVTAGQRLILTTSSDKPAAPTPKGFHRVARGETLYALSRKYNTTVNDLKRWNNLTGSGLRADAVIRVSDPEAATTAVKEDNTKSAPGNPPTRTHKKDAPKVTPIRLSEKVLGADEIKEAGKAALIEGAKADRKYLALHPKIPTGSIVKVRNIINNNEVFVRIIGPLSPSETQDGVIIKVSKSAFKRLGGEGDRIRIELTYYR